MRREGEKKTTNISRERTHVVIRAARRGGGHENAIRAEWKRRKLEIFLFWSPFLSRAAPPGTQLAVCKFFGMSARACNNFMEISSPAKYSHRVSRAGDATRIEKRGKRKKFSLPSLFLYLRIAVDDFFVSKYVGIENGMTFACLSCIHQRYHG